MSNLATALVEAARRAPQRPAVRVHGTVLTYAELDELSARVAGGLLAHGVRPGDRVGLRLPRVPAFPVLYFGVLRAGAVVVQAYSRPRSITHGARLILTAPGARRAADGEAERRGAAAFLPVGPDFLAQLAFWPQQSAVVRRADDDPAVLICPVERDDAGSGPGTGRSGPSGVTLSHGALRTSAADTARALMREGAADRAGGSTPVFSPDSRTDGLNAVLLSGACLPVARASAADAAGGGGATPRTVAVARGRGPDRAGTGMGSGPLPAPELPHVLPLSRPQPLPRHPRPGPPGLMLGGGRGL
ncbi:AMP-binding protein [Streptomyces sp. ODS28]|uniref:AMP-binding protein n=1 Tax=Streptomyces sp. ODS28 TaxID=3136688 RepID=UPI0031E6EF56